MSDEPRSNQLPLTTPFLVLATGLASVIIFNLLTTEPLANLRGLYGVLAFFAGVLVGCFVVLVRWFIRPR
jgi:hypothetical protein